MRGVLIGALAVLLVAGASPVSAVSPSPEEVGTNDDAAQFRQTFGLNATPEVLRTAAADTTTYSTWPYGVPLSKVEIAEMGRRAQVQAAVNKLLPQTRSLPGWGGVYLDQQAGGQPVFLFTSGLPKDVRDQIASALPAGTAFRVEAATRTEAQLLAQKAKIEADLPSTWASGIDVVRVAVKTSENRLRIGVHDLTDAERQMLLARYGAEIDVFEDGVAVSDACGGYNDCRPIKGGISINHDGGSAGECTSGFVVRGDTGALYLLTAGHCIQVHGGYDTLWEHDNDSFGRARRETWTPGGTGAADVGLITIFSAEQTLMTHKNQMRRTTNSVVSVVGVEMIGPGSEGGQACRVGRRSGHDCGIITEWSVGRASKVTGYKQMWVTDTTTMNFDSLGGDSGGSVFYYDNGGTTGSVVVLGTHVHSEEGTGANESWFSNFWAGTVYYEQLWGMGYSPCLTAAC